MVLRHRLSIDQQNSTMECLESGAGRLLMHYKVSIPRLLGNSTSERIADTMMEYAS